jgi:DNA-binding MarR family transcriptional regulator
MINPVLKDEILNYLIVTSPEMECTLNLKETATQFNTNENVVSAIIDQFEKRGFLNLRRLKPYHRIITLKADAHDFTLRGGYVGELEFLERQVSKLQKELESLEADIPKEKFKSIKGTLDTLLATISAWNSF